MTKETENVTMEQTRNTATDLATELDRLLRIGYVSTSKSDHKHVRDTVDRLRKMVHTVYDEKG